MGRQVPSQSISCLILCDCLIEPSVIGWLDNNTLLINTYNDGEDIIEMVVQVDN